MEYYILLPEDDINNLDYESNLLGEKSFNVFWSGQGLKALMNISKNYPEKLQDIRIIDSKNNNHTVEDFLKTIDRLEIRVQN